MLTEDKYTNGLTTLEQMKYNINYCKAPLFDTVCVGLADRLLNHEYSTELTEEQKEALNNIIQK